MSHHYYTNETIFSAGGVLLDASRNMVYLVYKQTTDEWLLPKGHLETSESIETTASREIFEETGYQNQIKQILSVQIRPDIQQPNKNKIIFWFLALLTDSGQSKNTQMSDENFTGKWHTLDDALNSLTWDEDKKLVKLAFQTINH
jgi:8-oxo-dGTP diphosphatase